MDQAVQKPVSFRDLQSRIGEVLGASPWLTVDQPMIDAFAEVTLDRQYIHIDPVRAAKTPFGGTIAHGFLTVSLLSHFSQQVVPRLADVAMSINYGFDRLRFVSPVRVGSEIRGSFVLAAIEQQSQNRFLMRLAATVEIKGESKPALSADWLSVQILSKAA